MRFRAFILAVGLVAIASGCSREDLRLRLITTSTVRAYDRWRSDTREAFRPEEWQEFDAMLQEVRLRIMEDREASGHEGVESALRSKIDGASFREVLVIGYQAKLARLTTRREKVRRLLNANAQKTGILSDAGPFAQFEEARAKQEKQLMAIDDEIRATKRRLTDFGRY